MARDLRLTVLGTGYLGVLHAACLADAGFSVLGVDTDVRLVAQLNAGSLAIHEPGLVKLAANAFLATKISFINAMAEICEAAGAHAGVLTRALGYDPRIGTEGMRPGLGFGGGCLPKDTRSLEGQAATLGAGGLASLLNSVDAINQRSRERMVSLAAELAGGSLDGARVGVLGLSFKPGTDDIRVARRAVADGRHALDAELWRAAGWLYGALGAPPPGDWSGSSGFSMTTKGNGHEHAVASGPGGRLAKFHRR